MLRSIGRCDGNLLSYGAAPPAATSSRWRRTRIALLRLLLRTFVYAGQCIASIRHNTPMLRRIVRIQHLLPSAVHNPLLHRQFLTDAIDQGADLHLLRWSDAACRLRVHLPFVDARLEVLPLRTTTHNALDFRLVHA